MFGPVVGALEKRRERIEKSIKEAKQIEERVEKFKVEHQDRLKESRREADAVIQKAIDTANETKAETVAAAHTEADKMLQNARATIEAEKERAVSEVRNEVAELTVAATEKIIQAKLDDKKDKDLIKTILREVK